MRSAEILGLLFVFGCVGAWVANVVKFFAMLDGGVTALFIARVVGIFVPPLGMVLGVV